MSYLVVIGGRVAHAPRDAVGLPARMAGGLRSRTREPWLVEGVTDLAGIRGVEERTIPIFRQLIGAGYQRYAVFLFGILGIKGELSVMDWRSRYQRLVQGALWAGVKPILCAPNARAGDRDLHDAVKSIAAEERQEFIATPAELYEDVHHPGPWIGKDGYDRLAMGLTERICRMHGVESGGDMVQRRRPRRRIVQR